MLDRPGHDDPSRRRFTETFLVDLIRTVMMGRSYRPRRYSQLTTVLGGVSCHSDNTYLCSVRYRYSRYRYECRTELTEVSGTSIDVVPKLPRCRYRYESLYRYRRCRYPCRTELTEVSGTDIDVVPNLPKCPIPVWMSYRTCRSIRHRY